MFCSECGHPAQGKFCSHCGTPLGAAPAIAGRIPAQVVADWDNELRYEVILNYPGVREAIERSAKLAPKRMSAEQFFALAEKVVSVGVPMEGLAATAQAFYSRLGVRTGKERTHRIAAPVSRVLVRVLCSLARNGFPLREVSQADDGCVLEAQLPSDMWALEGHLLIGIHRRDTMTEVHASTHIAGQWFDWGKSIRCLNRLFDDLAKDAA